MLISLLADTAPTDEQKLRALRFGFTMIIVIGVVGMLLIVALIGAWRNFHKRLRQLEIERDEARQALALDDAWHTAGQRVEVEPAPGPPGRNPGDDDDDDFDPEDDDDDSDLYGKDWEPGDDDENPDDDGRGW